VRGPNSIRSPFSTIAARARPAARTVAGLIICRIWRALDAKLPFANFPGCEEFDSAVGEMLELTDSIEAALNVHDRQSAIDHFVISARYEWMFWDAAYHRVGWPL